MNKEALLKRKWVAVDTETYGNIKKVSVYDKSIRCAYISYWDSDGNGDVFSINDTVKLKKFLKTYYYNPEYVKLFWNAPFDIPVLQKEDFKPQGTVLDGLLIAQIAHRGEIQFGLKHFAKKFLGDLYTEEAQLLKYIRRHKCDYGSVPLDTIYPYAIKDARCTLDLVTLMLLNLPDRLWTTVVLEHKIMPVALGMMQRGITVDRAEAERQTVIAQSKLRKLKSKILKTLLNPKLNLNSSKQLLKALWPEENYVRYSKKTGNPSSDNLALLLDGRPVARAIQVYRRYSKAISTYYNTLLGVPEDNYLHCNLSQSKAITGRWSASKPNLQNQPRPGDNPLGNIRACYTACSDDYILGAIDFSQIEIRLLACLANEPHMIATILAGGDVHTNTCKLLFDKNPDDEDFTLYRYLAKRLNFAVVYGTGADKFVNTTLQDTDGKVRLEVHQAREYIDTWWEAHPNVLAYKHSLLSEVSNTGGITTYGGRFIPVDSYKDHAILNYKVQGSAAVVLKKSMLRVNKLLKREFPETFMLLPVHDELLFDVYKRTMHECLPRIKEVMEDRTTFAVPITCSVKIGPNWGAVKDYEL